LPGKGELTVSLTIKDILEKTFKRSFKGYDENEVDKFLDEIIDELKALQSDNAALKEALDAEKERAKKTKEAEQDIMHTLVSAQKSAERILAEAAKKAEVIIDSAETTAKKRAENTLSELSDAQRRLDEVKNAARALAKKYNDLINSEAVSFEKVFRSYFGDVEGGMNVKALEKIDEDITESLKGMEEHGKAEAEETVIEKPAPKAAVEKSLPEPVVEKPLSEKPVSEEIVDENEDNIQLGSGKLMELTEINKALSEIENGGEDILQEEYETPVLKETEEKKEKRPGAYNSMYDDYSWLYGNEEKDEPGAVEPGVVFKDPKEKEELESLIDDIIDNKGI
jgi:cell division initiation protein